MTSECTQLWGASHKLATFLSALSFLYDDRKFRRGQLVLGFRGDFIGEILQGRCYRVPPFKSLLRVQIKRANIFSKQDPGQLNLAECPWWVWNCVVHLSIPEIKPCGLGFRIRDVEADLIYWWSFWASMEALRGQIPYSNRTLWHFNSMFGPSHSAKVCGRCMVCGL